MPSSQPHVIYILSDEHRGQAMAHQGDVNLQTPVMDRMAAQGASFARAYANCPICTPSRGTIFSGRHAHAGPVQNFWDVYKPTSPSTATVLREQGYHTAYFGKWHCGIVRDQIPPAARNHPKDYPRQWCMRTLEFHRGGFQDWFAFEVNNKPFDGFYYHNNEINPRRLKGYQTDALTDLAIEYLRDYDRDEPLFLVLSIEPPHFPLEVPEQFRRHDPATLKVQPNFVDTEYWRGLLATYYAMIENLDWNMGRLFDALATMPRFADTLSVYFSDHGDFMGSHGLGCRKDHPHEESVRIPAIFHWPNRLPAQGVTDDGLFSLVDLLPTTLGLLGVPIPSWAQGVDFSPTLRGEPFTGPNSVLTEMVGSPRYNYNQPDWRGLITQRWKYCYYETGIELLFDLECDPCEMHNLASENPTQCNVMRAELLQQLRQTREPYFDVLIEHPAPVQPSIHVGSKHNDAVAALLRDLVQPPSAESLE